MSAGSKVRRPLAVLVSRFPLITETFILREIIELERQGQPIVLVPMIREQPEVVHEEARPWVTRALFTPFLSVPIVLSLARALVRQPGMILRALGWIIAGAALRPANLLKSLAVLPKCTWLAEKLRGEGVTHIHAHFATHPTTMARVISALTGIPYSFTVHAHDIFVDRSLLREKIHDALFIRSISQFNKGFLESLYGPMAAAKTVVVHVGIDPDQYISEAARHANAPPRLISVAALKPYKGIPILVRACGELAQQGIDFECQIIGQGPMRSTIRRGIVKAGLQGRVHLRGALPQHVVAEEIRNADLFVLPSIVASDGQMEGIPVALMEAMAASVPVVATAISGVPELVEHQKTGLLADPGNPRSLADAIRTLLQDSALRERLARAGREKVVREFELSACVAELIAVLDSHAGDSVETDIPLLQELIGKNGRAGIRRARRSDDAAVYELMSADRALPEIVVKRHLSRDGQSRPPDVRAADEWRFLQALSAHFADCDGLGVPAPIRSDPATASVVMTRAQGVPLTDLLRAARTGADNDRARLRDAVRGAGAWLHHFQEFEKDDGAEVLAETVERTIRCCERIGAPTRLKRRVLSLRDQIALGQPLAVSHHGDYWPGNIYANGRAVEVIDFEGYRLSLRSHDVAYFLLHASLYLAWRGSALMALVRESFFEEYGQSLDPAELEFSRLATAVQLASRSLAGAPRSQRLARWSVLRREFAR
jgi:colanic acid/amylovoran biosynthesis glycosyltransferase